MNQQQILVLAYGSLMALIFAGTYVLGDDSWMVYLLFIPSFLILKSMSVSHDDTLERSSADRKASVRRVARIGLALVVVSIPAGLLVEALALNEPAKWLVVIAALFLVSLVDREYFGWTDPAESGGRRSTAD